MKKKIDLLDTEIRNLYKALDALIEVSDLLSVTKTIGDIRVKIYILNEEFEERTGDVFVY